MFNLPFLNKSQEDPRKFLSLNLNAKDVKCIAFYYDDEVFKIIGSGIKDLPEGAVRNGMVVDEDIVLEAVKATVEQATENSGFEIKKVIIGVDGGITTGLTTTVRMKRTSGYPIQPKEVDELYKKVDEAAFVQASKKLFETTGDPDIELKAITTSDVYIKIDDQKTATLEEQPGKNIEIAVFNSFVPLFHLKSLQNLAKKADLDIIAVGSQMYSLVEWIKSSRPQTNDFVLINLSEDSTDVGVIFAGGITATRTLNIGYIHFLESIGLKMGLSKKEAETILKMYNVEKLSGSEITLVRSCINEVIEIWIDGLKLLLEDFPGVKTFAPTVYLSGCGMDIKDIYQSIEEESWTNTIPFKDEPKFEKISFTDTGGIINSTDKNLSTDWVFVASTSWIYKKITEE
jgi:cell division ATPase FtsA